MRTKLSFVALLETHEPMRSFGTILACADSGCQHYRWKSMKHGRLKLSDIQPYFLRESLRLTENKPVNRMLQPVLARAIDVDGSLWCTRTSQVFSQLMTNYDRSACTDQNWNQTPNQLVIDEWQLNWCFTNSFDSIIRDVDLIILARGDARFLDEENFKGTAHRLEQESGFFFNQTVFRGNGDEWGVG
ncbi:hypothetical protein M8C21_008362 [Ambrosia artemisiifolia]|uniref:Uncharacterized protein n=1 Tax=Ambrosia artemisiifolia TaxID=4212 RepID=A0AAD5GE60_AMBAR|nr:hypothetical protein M8C21_008362 [Ambrosia artemisiifolia]